MRKCLTVMLAGFACLHAATLQQLSLDEMAQQSTAIVRAKVTFSGAKYTGNTIFSHYKLQVLETLKGFPTPEVMLPGGTSGNTTQTYPGVPQLQPGKEYLLFLWTSSSGITHLTGLSQGVFDVSAAADGSMVATRGTIGELMLDKTGRQVKDQGLQVRMVDVRGKVSAQQSNTGAKQ